MVTQRQGATAFDAVLRSGRVGSWILDGEPLGRGAFGVTFRAHKTDLDGVKTRAAIKLLMPTGLYDVDGFIREVRVLRALRSPYLPRVLEGGQEPTKFHDFSVLWFASELITGKTLQAEVLGEDGHKSEPLPELLWLETAHDLLSALQTVHAAGLVHLDLKPDNVLLVARKAILIDFGLASLAGDSAGGLVSAVGWSSPEHLDGKVDSQDFEPPVDLFKAGLTLYFAATGRRAWGIDPRRDPMDPSEQRNRMRSAPDFSGLSEDQRAILAQLLAFYPERRGTAAESVDRILDTLPESSGRHTDESRARAQARKRRAAEAAAREVERARAEEREKVARQIAAEREESERRASAEAPKSAERGSIPNVERNSEPSAPVVFPTSPMPATAAPGSIAAAAQPTDQSVTRRRRGDFIWTIVLLAIGSLATLFMLTVIPIYAVNPAQPSAVHAPAWILAIAHVILLAGAYLFGIGALRRGRLAFWIPLATGAIAVIVSLVCLLLIGSAVGAH